MAHLKNRPIALKEVEVEGRTLEDAIIKASALLKTPRKLLTIKVLSEEKKGLFGMEGAKPAKVRASIFPAAPQKKKA